MKYVNVHGGEKLDPKTTNVKSKCEHVKSYFLLAIIFLIICFSFASFHLVTDTYNVIQEGYQGYSQNFVKDGRVISALALQIGDFLNIPIKVFITGMGIFAILIQTLSVYLIYCYLRKEYPNLSGKKKYVLLAASSLIIFNPMTIEHLAYTESAVITLGTLCCTIAAIKINKEITLRNSILVLFLVIFAVLCYQGILNMFLTISALFLFLKEPEERKDKLKKIGLILLFSMLALIIALLAIKIGNNILGTNQDENRLSFTMDMLGYKAYILFLIIPITSFLIIKTNFHLFPQYIMLGTIIFTFIFFITQKEIRKNIWRYLLVLLVAILSSMFPLLIMTSPCMEPRISGSIGAIMGISIIFWVTQNKNDLIEKIIYIFTFILVALVINQYMQIGKMNIMTNALDRHIGEQIAIKINEYEKNTNKTVRYFSFSYDENCSLSYFKMPKNAYTYRGLSREYCIKNCVEYYTNHDLETKEMEYNIYEKYFKGKDWDKFKEEQIVIINDTLYMCIF